MMKRLLLIITIFFLPFFVHANDDDFRDAVIDYRVGNYKSAFTKLMKLAENGHVKAQTQVGIMFDRGRGVERDYKKAVYWYKKADAKGGHVASYNLGVMYLQGAGTEKNVSKALTLIKKAAANGLWAANYKLGKMYYNGNSVKKDIKKALSIFNRLVEKDSEKELPIKKRKAVYSTVWILSTSTETNIRDGKRAVEIMERYLRFNREDRQALGYMAMAHAEAGAYNKAIKTQEKANEMLDRIIRLFWRKKEKKNREYYEKRKKIFDKRLDYFRKKKPWRSDIKVLTK